MVMDLHQQMVLTHYNRFWGMATEVVRLAFSEAPQDAPFVAEFRLGSDAEPLYIYATIGMSSLPMPNVAGDRRAELFIYANLHSDELRQSLALLAIYPFQNNLALSLLDTIYGSRALVEGSQLTSALLTMPLREPEDFASLDTGDAAVQFMLVTPITESERRLCLAEGSFALLGLLAETGADVADLGRQGVI
jgi:Suppressor of fused protein (SUFU)